MGSREKVAIVLALCILVGIVGMTVFRIWNPEAQTHGETLHVFQRMMDTLIGGLIAWIMVEDKGGR